MTHDLRTRLDGDERGVTLVELLVVVLILTVVGGITMTGLVQGMQTTRYGQDRMDALAATQTGLERMSRELRAADPLRTAESGEVAVDVRRADLLLHFRYEVRDDGDGWEVVEERWDYDDPDVFEDPGFTPGGSPPDRVTVLVPDLEEPDPGEPVFTFLDGDGEEAATADEARRVEIRVERVVQPGRAPIVVETTVTIRNA